MIDLRVQEKKENKDIPRDSRFKVHIQLHSPCEDRKSTRDTILASFPEDVST